MGTPSVENHLRLDRLPHIWCAGCGNGIVLGAVVRAIEGVGLDRDSTVVVSGIGCSSRAAGYMEYDSVHTTHGRAIAFATGLKLANPDLKVIVLTGDGDCAAIGGNHFIHAARRNIDITTVVFNNSIYGMTSGQYSPLTPAGRFAATAPYGNIDRAFDLCELARAAGATYVGRSTTYHVVLLTKLIAEALRHRGFSLVEAVTPCPTYFGRRNKLGSPVEMLKDQRERAVTAAAAAKLKPEELKDRFVIGEMYRVDEPEYTEQYEALILRAQGVAEHHADDR